MKSFFICEICGNQNKNKIGIRNGEYYCRACIEFCGQKAPRVNYQPLDLNIKIDYELTPAQKDISQSVLQNFKSKKDTLIYAVCGAGKTELIFEVIKYALKKGKQVGFTIPRREVVIEIANRLKSTFPRAKVISVFGDQTKTLTGNIIVLTTHQLFRYPNYFDLLIFDEIDAFPYAGDLVLEAMFKKSIRGNFVILTATPSKKLLAKFQATNSVLTLFSRFHNKNIPVPRFIAGYGVLNIVYLFQSLRDFILRNKPVLIFVPTIREAEFIFKIIGKIFINGNIVHSKKENKTEIIRQFKEREYDYLVTTTVLERGVTIVGLQVIVFGADSAIYDAASLIQIAGRVGRKKEESDGEVIFIGTKKTTSIEEAIADIEEKNSYLQNVYGERSKNESLQSK